MTNSSQNNENLLVDLEIVSENATVSPEMNGKSNDKPPVMTRKSNHKMPWVIGGIAATVLFGGFVMFLGLVMIMAVASSSGGGGGGSYTSGYANGYGGEYGAGYGSGNGGIHRGPNGGWVDQTGWGNKHTSGTIDPNGRNSVYGVDGHVIDIPN